MSSHTILCLHKKLSYVSYWSIRFLPTQILHSKQQRSPFLFLSHLFSHLQTWHPHRIRSIRARSSIALLGPGLVMQWGLEGNPFQNRVLCWTHDCTPLKRPFVCQQATLLLPGNALQERPPVKGGVRWAVTRQKQEHLGQASSCIALEMYEKMEWCHELAYLHTSSWIQLYIVVCSFCVQTSWVMAKLKGQCWECQSIKSKANLIYMPVIWYQIASRSNIDDTFGNKKGVLCSNKPFMYAKKRRNKVWRKVSYNLPALPLVDALSCLNHSYIATIPDNKFSAVVISSYPDQLTCSIYCPVNFLLGCHLSPFFGRHRRSWAGSPVLGLCISEQEQSTSNVAWTFQRLSDLTLQLYFVTLVCVKL